MTRKIKEPSGILSEKEDLDALGVELEAVAPSADALICAAEALVELLKAKKRMAQAAGDALFLVFPDAASLYAEILRYAGMPVGAVPEVISALDAYWSARSRRAFSAARNVGSTAQEGSKHDL